MAKKNLTTQTNGSIKLIEGELLTGLNELSNEDLQQIIGGSQATFSGNIGSINRDESFNFESQNFGDSINNGIANVIQVIQTGQLSNSILA